MTGKLSAMIVAAIALLFSFSTGAVAAGKKRIALVIGNGAYQNVAPLANPVNDAAAMARMFKDAGFDSVTLKQNLGVAEFRRALREFFDVAQDADVAVVYYAGHGIQVGDVNYLVPVDAKLAAEFDVQDEAVSLDRVLTTLQPARQLRLVILDACREDPFRSRMKLSYVSRSIGRGLARVEPENNSLVAYAAKGGQIAEDGTGNHSPFTAALMKYLPVPGLDIRLALGRVRDDVQKKTANKQEPFVYGSIGGDSLPLVPAPDQESPADAKGDYELVERVGTRKAWEAFLANHGGGLYAELARAQLAKILQSADHAPPATESGVPELAPAATASAAGTGPSAAAGNERTEWDLVKNSGDAAKLRGFIARYPSSIYAEMAKGRLEGLDHLLDKGVRLAARAPDTTRQDVDPRPQLPDALSPVLSAIGELRRLGCVAGHTDPALGGAVGEAIKRYLAEKGRPEHDVKVVEGLLADLKAENDRLCAADAKLGAKSAKRKVADAVARRAGVTRDEHVRDAKQKRERARQAAARPGAERPHPDHARAHAAPQPGTRLESPAAAGPAASPAGVQYAYPPGGTRLVDPPGSGIGF